jgi:hypothetical protein
MCAGALANRDDSGGNPPSGFPFYDALSMMRETAGTATGRDRPFLSLN